MKRSTSGHDTNAKRLRCNALSPRQHVYVRTIHISHLFGSHRPMKSPRNDSDIEWKSFWIWAFIAAQPVDWQRRRIGAWKPQFHGLARHTSRRRAPSDDSQMYDRGGPFHLSEESRPWARCEIDIQFAGTSVTNAWLFSFWMHVDKSGARAH